MKMCSAVILTLVLSQFCLAAGAPATGTEMKVLESQAVGFTGETNESITFASLQIGKNKIYEMSYWLGEHKISEQVVPVALYKSRLEDLNRVFTTATKNEPDHDLSCLRRFTRNRDKGKMDVVCLDRLKSPGQSAITEWWKISRRDLSL